MKHVFHTEKGNIVLDTTKDEELYAAPENPPNTGSQYTRGVDLLMHETRKGNKFFYKRYWSMWQGEEGSIELITEQEAIDFFVHKTQQGYIESPHESYIARFAEIFPRALEETA